MTFGERVLHYHFQTLQPDWSLPAGVDLIFPYHAPDTQATMTAFYHKFFADARPRIFVMGINPGRFGAGVTGVPFTGPKTLREACAIEHPFTSRPELSSEFIYRWIDAMGGPEAFYRDFYITSACPLGFTKDGKNYNYYDSKALQAAVLPHIIANFEAQLAFGGRRDHLLVLGEGKNHAFITALNEQYGWFRQVIPLAHPRFVMQYKRRYLADYLERFVAASQLALEG
ncbi:DUF4918 family protein [Neolewinella lacunae]|uniref:DUF4918 family protein n=1 Tax=Neolewinella lacunae TaxID=1517758 RepID=A0A923PLT2_9BACT|nr:uracil-DNA glycosylase family protein [Neolewinella lacunae]MBC6994790.1 DUF4918 family protein [Neolewinella lacunae]MDN3634412.1 DUF4918 family protein [Neolewinella lacunae]